MKRIIDGVTYNTDTSTVVARYSYDDDQGQRNDVTIYKTRGGAFFEVFLWNEFDREWQEYNKKVYFQAISRDYLDQLVQRRDNLEIIDNSVLADPPEAEATANPERSMLIRVPASLGDRVTEAAKLAGLSMNSWTIRCLENCLGKEPETASKQQVAAPSYVAQGHAEMNRNMVRRFTSK